MFIQIKMGHFILPTLITIEPKKEYIMTAALLKFEIRSTIQRYAQTMFLTSFSPWVQIHKS